MINIVGQKSYEKIITTTDNIKSLDTVRELLISEMNTKSHFINDMSNEEYTNYLYLRLLLSETIDKKYELEHSTKKIYQKKH